MSGIDPMFVYSDTPTTPMEVGYVCVFDPVTAPGGYSFASVRGVLADRVPTLPPFRRRLMTVPLGLDHPRWVDDPAFDLDNHLHRAALPAPGGPAELDAMVAAFMGRPLKPGQPPWEMHLVEGLEGGRVALLAKVHHSVIDGVAGVQLLAQLLDFTADGRPGAAHLAWRPPALPSGIRLVVEALPRLCTSPLRAVHAAREVGRTAVRLARRALDEESALSLPFGAPSTFDTPVGVARKVALTQLDLSQIRAVKERLAVTINDVVLAICSGALRAYLADHDEEVAEERGEPLVAVVPISVRDPSAGDDLGNRLSAMFLPLANDVGRPLDRLAAIAAISAAAKGQERAVGYGPMASALSEAVPPAVAQPLVRLGIHLGALRRLRPGNLMVSNVAGPDFPLFFAGMQMEAAYPLGPVVDGLAVNVTVQSYLGSVFVGINAGATAVSDLPALARALVTELDHLVRAADAEEASRPAPYVRMGSIERRARSGGTEHSGRAAHSQSAARSDRTARSLDQAS